jgi:predicted MFS family arabinose efflux permease
MVTTWNLGIGLGGLVGGALLAGLGSWSLMIAAVVLLASMSAVDSKDLKGQCDERPLATDDPR